MNAKYEAIYVAGAGGTGGNVIPPLTRLLSHLPAKYPKLTLIDKDNVEIRNCQRQNFIVNDVGRNKAQVLAERYSAAFNIPVYYIDDFITNSNINKIIKPGLALIIDTVDKLKPRVIIDKFIKQKPLSFDWISLGNTDTYGQMVFYSKRLFGSSARTVVDVYPDDFSQKELQKEAAQEAAERENCAVNAVIRPQSLAINIIGANIAINLLYQLYYDKEKPDYDIVTYDRFNSIRKVQVGEPLFRSNVTDNDFSAILSGLTNLSQPQAA